MNEKSVDRASLQMLQHAEKERLFIDSRGSSDTSGIITVEQQKTILFLHSLFFFNPQLKSVY